MSKLVEALKQAHAIETGAYQAYYGHYKSALRRATRLEDVRESTEICMIREDEWHHREAIKRMLRELNAEPSSVQDALLWLIGTTISIGCFVMGRKMAAWGAGIMEKLGVVCYRKLAQVARDEGYPAMGVELEEMQNTEEEHRIYFSELV